MRAALIGLPVSGKTTVFEALTGIPEAKKEENIGTIKVPDARIDRLADIYKPKKKTYAEFILTDYNIPATKDALLSSQVKNLIQKADLLIFVLRNFDSVMTAEATDPLAEYRKLKDELLLTDLITAEKRIEREAKEKKNPPEMPAIKKLHALLETGALPGPDTFTADETAHMANYNFLTLKKRIALVNEPEGGAPLSAEFTAAIAADGVLSFAVSAMLEKDLAQMGEEEQAEFLADYGLTESARIRFINAAYASLGLISFLTAGEDEVRAWPIRKGLPAVEAAGKIHSDIQRGFIRAETIHFDDFNKYGSEAECKKAGHYRLEGKEYTVKDGDIINFRFNV
jgi:hypothetical protein